MTDSDPRSDGELLAATPRDPEAFAAFFRRHVHAVLGYVSRRAARDDVSDLVAEVFATALAYRGRYDPGRGSAGAWLTGIARNKMADARRRGAVEARMCRRLGMRRPEREDLELGPEPGGEQLIVLPALQRRALEARVLEDKSYRQIAREESVSEQAVRKRVSRALATLRSRLEEER
jgi:RNA polymerase sigma-70 factor (ECF subfamily)